MTVIIAAGFAVYFIPVLHFTGSGVFSPDCVAILMGAAIACVLFHASGVYDRKRLVSKTDMVHSLLPAWTKSFAVLLAFAFLLKLTNQFSRFWGVSWFAFSSGLLIAARLRLREWILQRAVGGVLAGVANSNFER